MKWKNSDFYKNLDNVIHTTNSCICQPVIPFYWIRNSINNISIVDLKLEIVDRIRSHRFLRLCKIKLP